MLFFTKKFLGQLLMPLGIVLILLFLAIVFSVYYRQKQSELARKLNQGCLVVGFVVLLISSTPFFSNQLAKPIEYQYSVFTKQDKALDYIVILGCGHITNNDLPVITQLQTC